MFVTGGNPIFPPTLRRKQMPTRTALILEKHTDEIWNLKFSHNGLYLASSSKDTSIIIWRITVLQVSSNPTLDNETIKEKISEGTNVRGSVFKVLNGHASAVSFISWNLDDSMILSAANDNTVKLWDIKVCQIFTRT
jgi:WD40 repeat protein